APRLRQRALPPTRLGLYRRDPRRRPLGGGRQEDAELHWLPSDVDREPRRAGLEECGDVLVDVPVGQPDRAAREVLQERADRDAGDGAGERRAWAEVGPVAERQVVGGVGAVDVELVAVLEDGL